MAKKFTDGDIQLIATPEILKAYDLFVSGDWIRRSPAPGDNRVVVNTYGYRNASSMRSLYNSADSWYHNTSDETKQYKFSKRYDVNTNSEQFEKDALEWYNMKKAKELFMYVAETYLFKKSPKKIFNLARKWLEIEKENEYRAKHPEKYEKEEKIEEPEEYQEDEIQTNLLR